MEFSIERVFALVGSISVFFLGLIGGLVALIYRNQLREFQQWRNDTDARFDETIAAFKDGIKEERGFRYNEMSEMKSEIKELFNSRKEICSSISDMKATCRERHK